MGFLSNLVYSNSYESLSHKFYLIPSEILLGFAID